MEGVLRKVFGRKGLVETGSPTMGGEPQLHPAMVAELQRLDLFRPGLGKLGREFVASGRPEGFPGMLASITSSFQHTSWSSPYLKDNAAVNDAQGKVDVALIRGEIPATAAIARFIAVRRLVRPMVTQPGWGQPPYPDEQLPTRELFSSLMQGEGRINSHSTHIQPPPPPVKTVGPRAILALVNQTGGDEADYFELALIHSHHDRIAKHPEYAELITAHPDRFSEAIGRMRNENQFTRAIGFARNAGFLALPPIEAKVVELLGKKYPKAVRQCAASALARLEPDQFHALLRRELGNPDLELRFGLVEAAGQARSPEVLALLAERGKVEKAAKVKAAIDALIEADTAEDAACVGDETGTAGYAAIDGSFVSLPPRKDLGTDEIPPPTDEACVSFVELVEDIEQFRLKTHTDYLEKNSGARNANTRLPPTRYSRELLEQVFAGLTQAAPLDAESTHQLRYYIRSRDDGQAWFRSVLERLSIKAALRVLKASSSSDIGGLVGTTFAYQKDHMFGVDLLRSWLEQDRLDLRDLVDGDHLRILLGTPSYGRHSGSVLAVLDALPRETVWPWVAENMEVLDEALGLKAAERAMPIDRALEGISLLPVPPQRYFAKLLEIAVTEKRPLRRQAMALLRQAKDLSARLEALLDDKRQPVRINAATWLADIRSTSSEAALRKRLKKEKSDAVRAALIVAMQRLDIDLSDTIGPASLIAEAEAANARSRPSLPE